MNNTHNALSGKSFIPKIALKDVAPYEVFAGAIKKIAAYKHKRKMQEKKRLLDNPPIKKYPNGFNRPINRGRNLSLTEDGKEEKLVLASQKSFGQSWLNE